MEKLLLKVAYQIIRYVQKLELKRMKIRSETFDVGIRCIWCKRYLREAIDELERD